MNLRNLFRVGAVLSMITGLLWLVTPETTVASYGLDLDPYGAYLMRILGTFNVALAVLAFLVSAMAHSPARQAVVTSFIIQQVLSGIVNLLAVLGGAVPGGVGWFGVAFNIVFALAFGYFRFIRPEASIKPGMQT